MLPWLLLGLLHLEKEVPPSILCLLRHGWVCWGAKIFSRLSPDTMDAAFVQLVVLKPFTETSWRGAHGTWVVEFPLYCFRPNVDGPS